MEYIRSRFNELTNKIKAKAKLLGIPSENFNCETDSIKLSGGGNNETELGFHLANLFYRGVFLIERIEKSQAIMLLLVVRAWLNDCDDTRNKHKLEEPECEIIALDADNLVDLICSIRFVDEVFVERDENGFIDWMGETFAAIPYDLWVAEKGEVNGANASER